MKGTMNVELIGEDINNKVDHCGIQAGILKLPEDIVFNGGGLLAVGENELYLHCFVTETGSYYGVFKSDDKDHLYQHLIRLNT